MEYQQNYSKLANLWKKKKEWKILYLQLQANFDTDIISKNTWKNAMAS
jgi:hypothetical protein